MRYQGGPPEHPGRALQAVGNGRRRWMTVAAGRVTSLRNRTRRTGRLIPQQDCDLRFCVGGVPSVRESSAAGPSTRSTAVSRSVDAVGETWAHSANRVGRRHPLREHLLGTARLARLFGDAFGAGEAAYAVGLLHDAGKVKVEWQERLRSLEAGRPAARVDHKDLGAMLAAPTTRVLGQLSICGHHGGIPDCSSTITSGAVDAGQREAFLELVPEAVALMESPNLLPPSWIDAGRRDPGLTEFATRMLHSALVDADFLDTASHFNADPVTLHAPTDFEALAGRFQEARAEQLAGRPASDVNLARASVYERSVDAARIPPGVFRLAAPTGSGKTIAAAGFALNHAASHGLRRVVVAVPFLTVTEQNAATYRSLVGAEHVIEHHSAIEPADRARYGVENWDSPFVVTTTVQLFESLFSNRPAKARKLHRLAGAVIVLDEIQALPPRILPVILDGLRILVEHFGSTVLLASATQPAWDILRPWHGRLSVHDVIKAPAPLFGSMKRFEESWVRVGSLEEVCDLVSRRDQALVVVNSTADSAQLARRLADQFGDGRVFHLSTRMCQAHRRRVLKQVIDRLRQGAPTIAVSTQLVEAGVDIDFPVVFRAMAPAESLLQAGGRANREGHLSRGELVIIDCPELASLAAYRTGVAKTSQVFGPDKARLDNPTAMRAYYEALYRALEPDGQPEPVAINRARGRLLFHTVAQLFQMIDDVSVGVLVAFDARARELLEEVGAQLDAGGIPGADLLRDLQPYAVSLPARTTIDTRHREYVAEVAPGLRVWRGTYDELVGVDLTTTNDTVW